MTQINYKNLQNGSDIRGIAMEGVEGELPNLTPAVAGHLAKGFLTWLTKKTGKEPGRLRVAIGRDPRLSGEALLLEAMGALEETGVTVLNCGLASTPAMFMATVFPEFSCDGAIMITASHLPFNRNGFKYFSREGGLEKADIKEVITYGEAAEKSEQTVSLQGGREAKKIVGTPSHQAETDLMEVYAAYLREKIKKGVNHPKNSERPLTGLKILVDAGNGGGGFYAEKVLAPLGADVSGSQFLEPNGRFPNHAPNPEDKRAMEAVSLAVKRTGADLGLIFDTDVDRSSAVDRKGREINRNGIVALAAALVSEEHPGTTVVTDSITSDQLTVFLERDLGLSHLRFKRGYKNVINEAIRLNAQGIDSQLAIETSGHAALKENYFLDDGAYLATKIVIKAAKLALLGQTLDQMIAGLSEPKEAIEVRLPIRASDFSAYGDAILEALTRFPKGDIKLVQPNYEGVRLAFGTSSGDGWCLLRKSLHDPLMPLNIESNREGGCKEIGEKLFPFLSQYAELDCTKLDFTERDR